MGTPFNSLITALKLDVGDDSLGDILAERAVIRAMAVINVDLKTAYVIDTNSGKKVVVPTMPILHQELLLMQALAHLIKVSRSSSKTMVSFRSGDKQVTRSGSTWKEVEKGILVEYLRLVKQENPQVGSEDTVISFNVKPVIYSRGSWVE